MPRESVTIAGNESLINIMYLTITNGSPYNHIHLQAHKPNIMASEKPLNSKLCLMYVMLQQNTGKSSFLILEYTSDSALSFPVSMFG